MSNSSNSSSEGRRRVDASTQEPQCGKARGLSAVFASTIAKNALLSIGLLAAIAGSVAFTLIPPLVLKGIVDGIAAGTPIALSLALLYFGTLALSGLFDAAKEALITVFGQKVTHGLRSRMCAKIRKLPAAYFTANETGAITSRFVNDVDTVEALFADGIISMFTDACTVVGVLVAVWFMSPGLGVIMVALTPLLFWLTRAIQKRMLKAQSDNRVAIGKVTNHVPETIRNIRMIASFHKQRFMEKRYDDFIQESYRSVNKSNIYDSIYSPIIITTSAVVVGIMFVCAALGGSIQEFFGMSVGTAVAAIAYVDKVFTPLEAIGMEIQNIQSAVAGVKRVDEFLDEPERSMPAGATPVAPATTAAAAATSQPATAAAPISGCISFEDVAFAYEDGRQVLDGISFNVQQGEKATLMGRTGAGKSTMFKLILGLYRPQEGHVRIFGEDACDIPDEGKRSLFGYVEQSARPVPGTIADQISLFDESISREQIAETAKLVGLDETISSLDEGYDTPFSPSLFSQGQLQLLSIARAAVADPPILLLDEITANLDSGTEGQVMDALRKASESRTVLSISHRLYENGGARIIPVE